MIVRAASAVDASCAVVLWNPAHRAYLSAAGDHFTRRLSRAAWMTREAAEALRATPDHSHMEIEPVGFDQPSVRARDAKRADLADLTETELLRRLVLGLSARDRSQAPHWCVVMDSLGLTSAAAVGLCRRLNIDPIERTGR